MRKRLLLISIFVCNVLFLCAQPEMTIWRIQDDGHDHEHTAEQYDCGSYYFFFAEIEDESIWSIKNEGDADLILELPLSLDKQLPRFSISQQPDQAILAPGEETVFKLLYTNEGPHGQVYMDIVSNDDDNQGCGLLISGNVLPVCNCVCRDNATTTQPGSCIEEEPETGGESGIILYSGNCSPEDEGIPCTPISISDPCSCDNFIIVDGQVLFRDTLTIDAEPGQTLSLSANNSNGFRDENNMDIAPSTSLGVVPMSGPFQYVFYRLPETTVDISVNGTDYVSPEPCSSLSDCSGIIPTISQWGIIILGMLLLIFSVVSRKQLVVSE